MQHLPPTNIVSAPFLIVCLIVTTMAQPTQRNELALRSVIESANQFENAFLQHISRDTFQNLIVSTLSAHLVLAMAAYGARNRTEREFRETLHLPQPDSVAHDGFRSLIDDLNAQSEGATLSVANKVFLDTSSVTLKPTYIDIAREIFRSNIEAVDFTNRFAAAEQINSWAKKQTNNRINDIVREEDLPDGVGLILVNAVYFKGLWKYAFNRESTSLSPFYISSDTVKNVPTMNRRLTVRYGESKEIGAKFVELPYKHERLSMVIILPFQVDGLAAVEAKLENVSIGDLLSNKALRKEVDLALPKFKIECKIQLNDILKKLGLVEMFEDTADFTGISEANDLYVDKVMQKAFVEVNEEGSEAAAVTAFELLPISGTLSMDLFEVDRPFHYAIVDTILGLALFRGHVTEPHVDN